MSTQHSPAVAADWYPDPSRKHQYRYWDGSAWTEHVSTRGVQSIAPLTDPLQEYTEQLARKAEQRAATDAARSQAKAARTKARDEAKEKLRGERDAAKEKSTAEKDKVKAQAAAERETEQAERVREREQRAAEKAERRAVEKQHKANNPYASFASSFVSGGLLHHELKKYDMTGASAEVTLGAPAKRSTVTRMGAGALLAGPAGFVLGALVRKNNTKCYVTIGTPNGVIVIEGPAKQYPAAVKFADAINRSSR